MKLIGLFFILSAFAISCSKEPQEAYQQEREEIMQEYQHEIKEAKQEREQALKQAEEEYQDEIIDQRKERAIDTIKDSDDVNIDKDGEAIQIVE